MKTRSTSWEIVLAGLLLTFAGIYVISGSDQKREEEQVVFHPKPVEAPKPVRDHAVVIDLQNLEQLKSLEKLKALDQLQKDGSLEELKRNLEKVREELKNNKELQAKLAELSAKVSTLDNGSSKYQVQLQDHKVVVNREYTVQKGQWSEASPGVYVYQVNLSPANVRTLNLDLDFGSITVEGDAGSQPTITLKASGSISSADELRKKLETTIDSQDGASRVSVDSKSRFGFFNNLNLSADLKLPPGTSLTAHTNGGHIKASGLDGNQDLETSGGHISLTNLSGNIKANTSGGHISAENLQGDLLLKTLGGNIEGKDLQGTAQIKTAGGLINLSGLDGSFTASTSGGNITAAFKRVEGEQSFSTSAGNIGIKLPPDTQADLELHGMNTSLDGALGFSGTKANDRIVGKLNGGGPKISASCSFGNVSVKQQ